jgi:hypothetical protein
MKNDVKNEVNQWNLEILIYSNRVLNRNEVSKLNNKLKKDHATHF